MDASSTDCDFMFRSAFNPGVVQDFIANPDGMTQLMHCFARDELDVYDRVDVSVRPDLRRDGKVVVVTGAGRGIGRVRSSICGYLRSIVNTS